MSTKFAVVYEEPNKNWRSGQTLNYLRYVEQQFNYLLKARGYVFLNEVYNYLNIPITSKTKDAIIAGWKIKHIEELYMPDQFIEFDISIDNDKFVIDFNAEEDIYSQF